MEKISDKKEAPADGASDLLDKKTASSSSKTRSSEKGESPQSLIKLMKKINNLLNENAKLKAKEKDYAKIYNQMTTFLKEIPPKNSLHKKANELIDDFSLRMEKHEKKKD